jgi:DNA-binding XRE family transcriptional regulator
MIVALSVEGKNMIKRVKSLTRVCCNNRSKFSRIIRGNYEFRESGLNNVVLCGIEIIKCDHCGNEDPILPVLDYLLQVIALPLVNKPYRLAGEEVRFLRNYLKLTGDKLSRLLHVDKTTLSKWENNDDPVGTQSDLAIRMITMSLDKGLKNKLAHVVREQFEKNPIRPASNQWPKQEVCSPKGNYPS